MPGLGGGTMKIESVLMCVFAIVAVGAWTFFAIKMIPVIGPAMPAVAIRPATPVASAPVASVASVASTPVASAPSPDDDDQAVKRKDDFLERCHMGGGIPVMGFGWRVVCLKPASAEWWGDPKFPEKRR